MVTLPSAGTSDVAGQVAIAQGVDSNVFQDPGTGGTPPTHHPAAFTALETFIGVLGRGRTGSSDLRAFGRVIQYEPLGPTFESRTARAGLSHTSTTRLDRHTSLLTTLIGSVGSLQAARGTDGTPAQVDTISTRRSTWLGSGSVMVAIETSPLTTFRALAGVDTSGTISETAPGTDTTLHRGLDFVVARWRLSVAHKLDVRTIVEGALSVERMHTANLLPNANPASPSVGSLDGGSASATATVSRLLTRQTHVNGTAGLTFALPQFGQTGTVLPVAGAGIVHNEPDWTASSVASFTYTVADPRLGPGGAATLSAFLIGRPLEGRAHNQFDIVAETSVQRSGVIVGPNDGASVTNLGGSLMARWVLGGGFGLLAGYDFRTSRFVEADGTKPPSYTRHLGFIGLSYAWLGSGATSPMPTLARPTASPFTL